MSARSRSVALGVGAVLTVGVVLAALLAAAAGASVHDGVQVIGLAAAGSVVTAVAGSMVVHRLRARSLRAQVVVIALASTVAVVAGALIAAQAMFISDHDLSVLGVVLAVAGAVSVAAALRLGSAFERSTEHVAALARQLAGGGATGTGAPAAAIAAPAPVVTGELQRLAAQLAEVSSDLDASRRQAAALDASRRELVAWVSHDLRSPIASVRAMAEALEDGVVDDAASVERYHRSMRQESERLGALVDDLFELSRITAGVIDAEQPLVPLAELVSEVVSSSEVAASRKGVRVVNVVDDEPAALVPMSDFRRVLQNLLDNAVRHTRPGGTIVVGGELSGRTAVVHVTDECGGIPEGDLSRVFDVAFRGDHARSRDDAGGGLGLAIAKGLLEAHHGSIAIANQATGCRFTVRFPVVTP
jgi:signal transduction histidine kinase